MIEIRRLEDEDIIQIRKMHTIVYNMRRDYSKEEDQKKDPLDHPANWAWGAFEGKKLLAGMYETDYLMRFDGNSVKMSGIGGVGTLPEERRNGHVRRIFEKLLPQAYDNGAVFSCLTPFSHEFYRKFGYETACARKNIVISTKNLSALRPDGQFIQIMPGDDTAGLEEVHLSYIADINHGIHRNYWPENRAWRQFIQEDPYTTGTFVYLWKDENGEPKSYIKYKDVFENDKHNMAVSDLIFKDKKGLYGALGITGGLCAQFKKFKWQMPSFLDPFDFINDAWEIGADISPREMTRVVNVKKALELMRRNTQGEYTIEVKDDNISANSGKYHVELSPSQANVSRTAKEADISCSIQTLSQLVTGYRSLENALYSRRSALEVRKNQDTLKRVFTQRPQHLTEYF